MLKKVLSTALILALLCFLAACSKNNVTEPFDPSLDDRIPTSGEDSQTLENANTDGQPPIQIEMSMCMEHAAAYHSFEGSIIDYIGDDETRPWFDSTDTPVYDNPDGCMYSEQNIYAFIRYFDFPKDKFIEIYNTYSCEGYNVELLYNGTAEEVDQYYRAVPYEMEQERIKLKNLHNLKRSIVGSNKDVFYDGPDGTWNTTPYINSYSLIEMLRMTDTSLEKLKQIIEEETAANWLIGEQYDYQIESFKSKDDAEIEELIQTHSPFYIDCLFCGITPYETKYDKLVADNRKYGIIKDDELPPSHEEVDSDVIYDD